uniref:Uncharacterized protein n=1 Tax=Arundo donax TaxID=35708 RepID=A0A0A8YV58_ARUDO
MVPPLTQSTTALNGIARNVVRCPTGAQT